jgi:tetratricopeptide (TPR) repeat protein
MHVMILLVGNSWAEDCEGEAAARVRATVSAMKTLYDLLGALPEDDAEGLRTAFRNAVRATHPDINPDDPDAPLMFRQIVRANAILSDAEQRATYDRLLALALRQPDWEARRSRFDTIRKIATDLLKVACLSALSIGGYLLFEQVSRASIASVKATQVAAHGLAEIATVAPAAEFETAGRDKLRDRFESVFESVRAPAETIVASDVAAAVTTGRAQAGPVTDAEEKAPGPVAAPANTAGAQASAEDGPTEIAAARSTEQAETPGRDKPESTAAPGNAVEPSADAPAPPIAGAQAVANAGPTPGVEVNDPKSSRQRGISAYRDGDLQGAVAAFDRAIKLDPGFADAYIDRGIAFYRMHQLDRAFADIARAKHLESARRPRTSAPPKTSLSSAKN